MFVIYENDDEVVITTDAGEKECIREFFTEAGQDLEEYDRHEFRQSAVAFSASCRVNSR